jgi:eukaryotic-like serine/threonine-protein kinase
VQSVLGPFVLEEKLALGGMAEIWSAKREGELVALKILQPMFSKDQSFRAMFQDEVDIATRLTHANIVQVYGAHEYDGWVMQSMELIEGRDLRRLLSSLARAGRWFPVRFAMYLGQQVARALAYAHARRGDDGRPLEIVHRDVSPHNVMVARDGRVKVLDFGIARATERLARTRPGVVKGKIPYMAPEQALAVGVSPQTDIFALGVVLWETLAMRRLFRGESDPEVLQQVVRAEIPPLTESNEKVPDDVAALIHRMLAQRAADRPASMQEVENELGRMLARHFGEVAQADFAAWAEPFLEGQKRAPTMVQEDPTEPNPAPEEEDLSNEAQDAFAEAMASWESPAIESEDITETPVAAEETPTPVDTSNEEERLRMPTKSEIIRAVDSVNTIPVRAEEVLAAIPQKIEVQESTPSEPANVPDPKPEPEPERTPAPTVTLQVDPPATKAVVFDDTRPPEPPRTNPLPLIAMALALIVVIALALMVLAD